MVAPIATVTWLCAERQCFSIVRYKQAIAQSCARRVVAQLRARRRTVIQRFEMICHHPPTGQSACGDHVISVHQYLAAKIKSCPAGGQHGDIRLLRCQTRANVVRKDRVPRDVDTGFAGQLDQLAMAMLHQLADKATSVDARD